MVIMDGREDVMSNVELKKSLCFGCHSNCGVLVTVEDGKATKIEGDPQCPINQGKVCERVGFQLEWLDHPKRLNYPLKRIGARGSGKWQQITWDQACKEIGAELRRLADEYGPETVVFSHGTGRSDEWYISRFFNQYGSPNVAMGGAEMCWCPTYSIESATFGQFGATSTAPNTQCVVFWGRNPAQCGDFPEHWGYSQLFANNPDAKIIVVDPRCTEYAARADIWLRLRPGTDGALALGWMNVIINEELYNKEFVEKWTYGFDQLKEAVQAYTPEKVAEITWVPAAKIRAAARMYATIRPCFMPWGLPTDTIGRNMTQANRAKALLKALVGVNEMGQTYLAPPNAVRPLASMEMPDLLPVSQREKQLGADQFPMHSWPSYQMISDAQSRVFKHPYFLNQDATCTQNWSVVSQAIRTGKPYPVKGMICFASNPFSNLSNSNDLYECIKLLDLMVTHEYTMTPAVMLSDYVLPAAGWLERVQVWGTNGGGPAISGVALTGEAAIEPLYERRDNYAFWRSLAEGTFEKEEFEKYWPWKDSEEANDFMVEPLGVKSADTVGKPVFCPSPDKWHELTDPQTGELYGFGTPTGKVEIYSTILEKLFSEDEAIPYYEEPFESPVSTPELAAEYPLILTAGSRFMPYYHSEYRQVKGCRERYPDPYFQIHPETAANLGIGDGMWCWIETLRGKCLQRAKLDSGIMPQVVSAQHGWWFPELPEEDPWLGGWFISNINMCTDNAVENCCKLSGVYNMKLARCKVYKAAEAPFNTFTK